MSKDITLENAMIESTSLGIERGVFLTFYLHLKYDGSGQGAGGWLLANTDCEIINAGVSCRVLADLLNVIGVDKWENLTGRYIRVKHTWGKVISIGHIIKEKWFNFEDIKDYALPSISDDKAESEDD